MRLELFSSLVQGFLSWSCVHVRSEGRMKGECDLNWRANAQTPNVCKREKQSHVCHCTGIFIHSLCLCPSWEEIWMWLFLQELDTACSFALTQRGCTLEGQNCYLCWGFSLLWALARVMDGGLGVVAFCAERSLYRPLFCFKNQAPNSPVTGERLHKSHLVA